MNQGSAQNYATGFAHVALCGATGWAIHETDSAKSPIAFGCFAFLLAHGLLGVIKHTHPHVQRQVESLYRHSRLLAQIIPLALITTQLNLDDAVPYAYLHAATALVPTLCEIALPERNERALDVVCFHKFNRIRLTTNFSYLGDAWQCRLARVFGRNERAVLGHGTGHIVCLESL